ncbi:MAG TPA: isocitrate lyase/phosphoenolpyruvate mutase family protein [Polyangiaceae bacterium]
MSNAGTFRSLHHAERVLVLPNAWDAASARLVEECGATAIATTSAAVAWAHGRADGEQLEPAALLATVRAIVRVVRVPVSVDAEAGYSDAPEGIEGVMTALVDAGAVGVNLEDGVVAPERLAEKVGVAKRAAARAGAELYVNARTDVYLKNLATGDAAVAETLRRARMYRDAGADGLFVPGLVDPESIRTIAREAGLPLNLLARANLAPVEQLWTLGVRRLSVGGSLALAALGLVRRATRELLDRGTYGALFAESVAGGELNGWFKR